MKKTGYPFLPLLLSLVIVSCGQGTGETDAKKIVQDGYSDMVLPFTIFLDSAALAEQAPESQGDRTGTIQVSNDRGAAMTLEEVAMQLQEDALSGEISTADVEELLQQNPGMVTILKLEVNLCPPQQEPCPPDANPEFDAAGSIGVPYLANYREMREEDADQLKQFDREGFEFNEAAGAFMRKGYKHADREGPHKTYLVPENWKHADKKGPDFSKYFPPDWKHADQGRPMHSMYVPGDWKHVNEPSPFLSRFVPPDYKHADKKGFHFTWYLPPDHRHNEIPGPHVSRYFAPDWKHVDREGPDKSKFYPPYFRHIEKGPQKSWMLPKWWKHNDKGPREISRYYPPPKKKKRRQDERK